MSLSKKLLDIKKAVRHIQPDKKGYGYDYASPSKVLGVFNPLFEQYGVLLTCEIDSVHIQNFDTQKGQRVKGEDTLKYGSDIVHNVSMTYVFTCVDSGDERRVKWAGVGSNGTEQGFGSALTYGERYFLLKFFGIPVDKDDPNQIRTSQQMKAASLKKMTKAEADKMKVAIKNGNNELVKVMLDKYEDSPEKQSVKQML